MTGGATDDRFLVGVNFLVVPDGVHPRPETGKPACRLSVSVTPNVMPLCSTAGGARIDIRRWPERVAELGRCLRVLVAEIAVSGSPPTRSIARPRTIQACSDIDARSFEEAGTLWRRIFCDDDGFLDLIWALEAGGARLPPADYATAQAEASHERRLTYATYDTGELARCIEEVYDAAAATTLLTRLSGLAAQEASSPAPTGGYPLRHFDASQPGLGWWDLLQQQWALSGDPHDPVARLERASGGDARAAAGGAPWRETAFTGDSHKGGHRLSRALFREHVGEPEFWRSGAISDQALKRSSRRVANPARAAGDVLRDFRRCWDPGVDGGGAKALDDDRRRAAARKWAGLLSYPTLAKYLGLIVDVWLEPMALAGHGQNSARPGRLYGALAVDAFGPGADMMTWPTPDLQRLDWSSFVLVSTGGDSGLGYFGPCGRQETIESGPVPNQAIRDGLLDLTASLGDGPRFELVTLDVTNATTSLGYRVALAREQSRIGSAPSDETVKLPELRTRGIALIDRGREQEERDALEREQELKAAAWRILDAEDLRRGYRIDVGLTKPDSQWAGADRWRSLVGRELRYGDVEGGFLKAVADLRDRDDGQVRAMRRRTTLPGETRVVADQELFAWTGESLAVPARREPPEPASGSDRTDGPDQGDQVWPCPVQDLAVNLEFDLPRAAGGSERCPPPLREGRGYFFGARVAFVNGCSLSLGDAIKRYANESDCVVIGHPSGEPYVFRRHEEIQAPDVLLPWDECVVTAPNPRQEAPGETIDQLVVRSVRSGRASQARARRYLLPPRTTFDLSEQGGVFDQSREERPLGAFNGDFAVLLDQASGTFPVARKGGWDFINAATGAADGAAAPLEPGRGSVLVLDRAAQRPKVQYYVDPLASCLHARFLPDDAESATLYGRLDRPVDFWPRDRPPSAARPIILELRAGQRGRPGAVRAEFDALDRAATVASREGGQVQFDKLAVMLQPAEVIDLELWAATCSGTLRQRHHGIGRAVETLRAHVRASGAPDESALALTGGASRSFSSLLGQVLSPDSAECDQCCDRILAEAPFGQVSTRRVVRLVHAVDRPLVDPAFAFDEGQRLRFHAVVLTRTGNQDEHRAQWRTFVESHGQNGQLEWPSEEGGASAFFVGALRVDRASTGRVRCEARWEEHGPSGVRQDAHGQWQYLPPFNRALLFAIDEISTRGQRSNAVDLLRDDTGQLRALSHAFVNGKARRLILRLVATSRFTDFYPPPSGAQDSGQLGAHEAASPDFDRSAPEVWVPATFRPSPPEVDRLLPIFHWKTTQRDHGREIAWTRESSHRIYLKKDSWHSTGEGERLGLVCWPEGLVDPRAEREAALAPDVARMDVCALEASLGPFGQYVTRWGADPIHLSGAVEDLIPADRLLGFSEKVRSASLRLAKGADSAPSESLCVSVVVYEPRLDPYEGLWYCDVTVDPGSAYFPFLQLGLVRYQAHCVDSLELSTPVRAWTQIPPRREGRVVFKSDTDLVVEVHGVGYWQSNTGARHDAERTETDVPLLNLRVLCAAPPGDVPRGALGAVPWRPALNRSGSVVDLRHLRPIRRGAEVWWVCPVTLPRSRYDVRYGLLIEEVERLAADRRTADGQPVDSELEDRGPMFSTIIDLGS